jgi:hypothetical protein
MHEYLSRYLGALSVDTGYGGTMYSWEWEDFEDIIKSHQTVISDPGPLKNPIRSFVIERDPELGLVMQTRGPQDAKGGAPTPPPGTVRHNMDAVTFTSIMGLQLVAEGVQPNVERTKYHDDPTIGELQQDSSVYRLKGSVYPYDRVTKYVIDWLANLDSVFHWPDNIEDITETKKTRKLGSDSDGPEMSASSTSGGNGRRCVQLIVDGFTLFLCCSEKDIAKHVDRPGYIVYLGNPSDEFRDKVRRCLSFALGMYLVYLGYSSFCENWELIHFEAVAAYSLGGKAFDLGPMPPSPLGSQWEWEINREVLSRAVNALYNNYEALNFGTVSWAYWHAVAATPHIAGAHYGAAIESLERAYLNTNGINVKRALLDEQPWTALQKELDCCITQANLNAEVAKILGSKISKLNEAPQSVVTDNLLSSLGLSFGDRESRAASLVRNKSAHGKDDEVDIEWIRNLHIVRIRFHRMLVAMTSASDHYYDYFTIGRPTRGLAECIPDKSSEKRC